MNLNYLQHLGFRKPLTPDDLWDLDPKLTSKGQVPKFDSYLDKAHVDFSILPSILKTFGPMFLHGAAMKIFCGK